MNELLLLILLLIVFISIPLLILYWAKEWNRRRALNIAERLPEDVKRQLRTYEGYTEITMKERLKHSLRIMGIGFLLYAFIVVFGMIRCFIEKLELDMTVYIGSSIVILAFIVVLVFVDILKVAPWAEVYRIKAVPCMSVRGKGGGIYVCYYDFVKEEMAVDILPDTSTIPKRTNANGTLDVLAVAKIRHVKLIDVIK